MENPAEKILVLGASGNKGKKVAEFLKNRGFLVFGADKIADEEDVKNVGRFFRLNLRHKDSLWLMFSVVKPEVLIYVAISPQEENYSTFLVVISKATEFKVKKIALILKNFTDSDSWGINNLYELSQKAMIEALKIISRQYKIDYKIINENDNLLKELKKFLQGKL